MGKDDHPREPDPQLTSEQPPKRRELREPEQPDTERAPTRRRELVLATRIQNDPLLAYFSFWGNKDHCADQIAAEVKRLRGPDQTVLDVFTGGANIIAEVADSGPRIATDSSQALITMFRALLGGWDPPRTVDEDLYNKIKVKNDPFDPMTAYVSYGFSYSCKFHKQKGYFGGPKRGSPKKNLLKQVAKLKGVRFECADYRELDPVGYIVIADPPYDDNADGYEQDSFNTREFCDVMLDWAQRNKVLITHEDGRRLKRLQPHLKLLKRLRPKNLSKSRMREKLYLVDL